MILEHRLNSWFDVNIGDSLKDFSKKHDFLVLDVDFIERTVTLMLDDNKLIVINADSGFELTSELGPRLPIDKITHRHELSNNIESLSIIRSIFNRYPDTLVKIIIQNKGEYLVMNPKFTCINNEWFCVPEESGFFLKKLNGYHSLLLSENSYVKDYCIQFYPNKCDIIAIRDVSNTYEMNIYEEFMEDKNKIFGPFNVLP
jgi:hypothetical protein